MLSEKELQVVFEEFQVSEFISLMFWKEISCTIVNSGFDFQLKFFYEHIDAFKIKITKDPLFES